MGFFNDLGKAVSETGRNTIQKTKEMTDAARINISISDEERKIKNACTEIGKLYAAKHKNDYEDEYAQYFDIIKKAENNIELHKEELCKIKGVVKCPSCGAEISNTVAFCSSCGSSVK